MTYIPTIGVHYVGPAYPQQVYSAYPPAPVYYNVNAATPAYMVPPPAYFPPPAPLSMPYPPALPQPFATGKTMAGNTPLIQPPMPMPPVVPGMPPQPSPKNPDITHGIEAFYRGVTIALLPALVVGVMTLFKARRGSFFKSMLQAGFLTLVVLGLAGATSTGWYFRDKYKRLLGRNIKLPENLLGLAGGNTAR